MNEHIFISSDGQPHGRWLEAFPHARIVTSVEAALNQIPSQCVVWCLNQRRENLAKLVSAAPQTPPVVMSLRPQRDDAMAALEAGASGYCHALATPGLLQDIATVVSHGGLWVGRDLMNKAVQQISQTVANTAQTSVWSQLTDRECQVGEQITQGASNREIATKLSISERTVKAHMAAMFEKLNVRDRLQLAVSLAASKPPQN